MCVLSDTLFLLMIRKLFSTNYHVFLALLCLRNQVIQAFNSRLMHLFFIFILSITLILASLRRTHLFDLIIVYM